VLAKNEPHHHPAFEDSTLRVLRVDVPAHDTTLLHEHATDYFWIGLGSTEVVNVRKDEKPASIISNDMAVHYTVGKFAHVARNPGTTAFKNITVELLKPQVNVMNRCEEAMTGLPLICGSTRMWRDTGVTTRPAFQTAALQVSLVTLEKDAIIRGDAKGMGSWIIALNAADAGTKLHIIAGVPGGRGGRGAAQAATPGGRGAAVPGSTGGWKGGVFYGARGTAWAVHNGSGDDITLIEVAATPKP
jgi:hypothetical protein